LKTSLDNLKQLNDLNISGNKICSFKEALNLNRLGKKINDNNIDQYKFIVMI